MKSYVAVALLALLMIGNHAAAEQKMNCGDVLERWAVEPDAVNHDSVEYCKGVKGVVAAPIADDADAIAAAATAASVAAADPCTGPNAGASVHCWGPWGSLAPAAAGAPDAPQATPTDLIDQRPELAANYGPEIQDPIDPPLPPEVPLGACNFGLPCGFASIVVGTDTKAPADQTALGRFELASDGSEFLVLPTGGENIQSASPMLTSFSPRGDEYESMRALGADTNFRSLVLARVIRNTGGDITEAADIWMSGEPATGQVNSGFFAWGTAISQAGLDELNAGNGVSATFSGVMSIDNRTTGTITVDFGSQPSWVGTWANPDFSFDAGGVVYGPDLVSEAASFSDNVGADSFVRGTIVGRPDSKSIASVYDVNIAGIGRVKDVGLLRE